MLSAYFHNIHHVKKMLCSREHCESSWICLILTDSADFAGVDGDQMSSELDDVSESSSDGESLPSDEETLDSIPGQC